MNEIERTSPVMMPEHDRLAWIEPDPSASPPAAKLIELRFDPQAWAEGGGPALWVVKLSQAESAVPEAIWHGRLLAYRLPMGTDAVEFTKLVNWGTLNRLLDRIAAGHSVKWDGANMVGRLDEDAAAAADELADWLDNETPLIQGEAAGFWEARDWIEDWSLDRKMLIELTDDELDRLAEEIEEGARDYGAVLVGTRSHLAWLRERAREMAAG